ncbi:unnamed protein product [Darwinula stevensoni]|uniref:Dimethylglycine dehydrogenase n=1 Tax=Darwinula stevensoni TaxID=69355 RepID=A0A7R9FP97_9CRUS|nr:unnamed protein product [Darwinula stevensoni]CAG0897673.1 unnamed protein product [Darwinula stevensoni]
MGLDLPLVPIHHQYVVTSSIPEVQALRREIPVLRHLDGSFYLRMERDGLLVGPYESQESMRMSEDWVTDRVPPGFGKELFQPDLDRLAPHLEVAMEAVPCFARASIQTVVNGPITYSPDLLPLVGPTRVPNAWLAAGFGYGIIHAGGMGKYLADWMIHGEPPYDLIEVDPLRYGKWTDNDFLFAKARESYGLNNSPTYPKEERFAGRPTQRVSGIHSATKQRGAFMHFAAGWEVPAWFAKPGVPALYQPSFTRTNHHEPVLAECDLVTNTVGVTDLTAFGKFEIVGRDARKFLDHATANTVPKEGRTAITHCLTPRGRVYAEITLTCLERDTRWLEEQARLGNYQVEIANRTDELGVLSIAGPKSRELLRRLTTDDVDRFPFLSIRKMNVGGVDLLALRISYTGELGWEFYLPRDKMGQLYAAILDKGRDLGVGDFGGMCSNVLRLEKGFRLWGAEMNVDTNPLEAGLHMFLNLNKEFLGKKAILEYEGRGVYHRKLVMLDVDTSNVDPEGNESIWCSGKVVGNTTSGCFSHALNRGLAFAYLPPFLALPGTQVDVELLGEHRTGTVLARPPVETEVQLDESDRIMEIRSKLTLRARERDFKDADALTRCFAWKRRFGVDSDKGHDATTKDTRTFTHSHARPVTQRRRTSSPYRTLPSRERSGRHRGRTGRGRAGECPGRCGMERDFRHQVKHWEAFRYGAEGEACCLCRAPGRGSPLCGECHAFLYPARGALLSHEPLRKPRRASKLASPPREARLPQDAFGALPDEMLEEIFSYLDDVSLYCASRACRRWGDILARVEVGRRWREGTLRRWPLLRVPPRMGQGVEWGRVYADLARSAPCLKCLLELGREEGGEFCNGATGGPRNAQPPLEGWDAPGRLSTLQASIDGPSNSPYEGGRFFLAIHLQSDRLPPNRLPSSHLPPQVRFLTKIFHPNVSRHGDIGIDFLHEPWSPSLRLHKLLLSIQCLLTNPYSYVCMEPAIGELHRQKPEVFARIAAAWTRKFAMHDHLLI